MAKETKEAKLAARAKQRQQRFCADGHEMIPVMIVANTRRIEWWCIEPTLMGSQLMPRYFTH